jgi:hypothetical protein
MKAGPGSLQWIDVENFHILVLLIARLLRLVGCPAED